MAAHRLATKSFGKMCFLKLLLLWGVGGGSPSPRQKGQRNNMLFETFVALGGGGVAARRIAKRLRNCIFPETFVALGGGGLQPVSTQENLLKK